MQKARPLFLNSAMRRTLVRNFAVYISEIEHRMRHFDYIENQCIIRKNREMLRMVKRNRRDCQKLLEAAKLVQVQFFNMSLE